MSTKTSWPWDVLLQVNCLGWFCQILDSSWVRSVALQQGDNDLRATSNNPFSDTCKLRRIRKNSRTMYCHGLNRVWSGNKIVCTPLYKKFIATLVRVVWPTYIWPTKICQTLGGGQHITMVCILAYGPSCPWFNSQHSQTFWEEKIINVAEVNQGRWLEKSEQWLENVDQTPLVLASGIFSPSQTVHSFLCFAPLMTLQGFFIENWVFYSQSLRFSYHLMQLTSAELHLREVPWFRMLGRE